jgi:CheY-like chemotaxis protein
VDLRLGDGNGLDVVSALKRQRPDARAIVLTGYGNIATAVTAVKMGAVDYLSKPADADDVVAALLAISNDKSQLPQNPMSADRVRWEHIQRIYEMCNRNVSETARRLNMHRRTLQRILAKRARALIRPRSGGTFLIGTALSPQDHQKGAAPAAISRCEKRDISKSRPPRSHQAVRPGGRLSYRLAARDELARSAYHSSQARGLSRSGDAQLRRNLA